MKTIGTLEKLGLTRNEAEVYLYLLKKGVANGTEVYVENSMDKASGYRALNSLVKKKLIYCVGQPRNQKFFAGEAKNLLKLQEEKQQEIEKTKIEIVDLINGIDKYVAENYKTNKIHIYEGREAYKEFLFEKLKVSGSVIRSIGNSDTAQILAGEYSELIGRYRKERIAKNIFYRGLKDQLYMQPTVNKKVEELKEVRRTPENLITKNISFGTFDTRFGYYHFENNIFWGVIIEDFLVVTLLNKMFDFIWDSAEIIY
jgi:sugar-specific transcriptional regulator TrmB